MINIKAYGQPKPSGMVRSRKCLGLIHQIVSQLKQDKVVTAGEIIETKRVYDVVVDQKLLSKWDRDATRRDEFGVTKSIGDLLGGHGLGLRKSGRTGKYVMPDVLPKVSGDSVIAEAVYAVAAVK